MMQIPLQALPNQEFSIILDNNNWDMTFKTVGQVTTCSLVLNGEDLLDNALCVSGFWVIPSIYQEAGNFFFVAQAFQLPAYPQFGSSQYLIYASPSDLAALRAPVPPPVTAAQFNPIAALPLRFSPQGY
jgi:hypothetical protein